MAHNIGKINARLVGFDRAMRLLARADKAFIQAPANVITGPRSQAKFTRMAKQVILNVVYATEPGAYERTFAILKHTEMITISASPPIAALTVRLNEETRAKLGPRDVTYARFFLPQASEHSFLNRTVNPALVQRDFFSVWSVSLLNAAPRELSRELNRLLRR